MKQNGCKFLRHHNYFSVPGLMMACCLLFVSCSSGCGGSGEDGARLGSTQGANENAPPKIIRYAPMDQSTEVPTDTLIEVTFNVGVQASLFESDTFALRDDEGGVMPVDVSYDEIRRAVILTPKKLLLERMVYTLTVDASVKNFAGIPLGSNHTVSFETDYSLNRPRIIGHLPDRDQVGVPVDQIVSVQFNKSMNPATINTSTFYLFDAVRGRIPSIVEYNDSRKEATLNPTEDLDPSTNYTVYLEEFIEDLEGNRLAGSYSYQFSSREFLWHGYEEISQQSNENNQPRIRISTNESGDAYVVWRQTEERSTCSDRTGQKQHLALISHTFQWSWDRSMQTIDECLNQLVSMSISNSLDESLVVWAAREHQADTAGAIYVRRNNGQTWQAQQTLYSERGDISVTQPDVDFDAGSDFAATAWRRVGQYDMQAIRMIGGQWQSPEWITQCPQCDLIMTPPKVKVLPAGMVMVAWLQRDIEWRIRVRASYYNGSNWTTDFIDHPDFENDHQYGDANSFAIEKSEDGLVHFVWSGVESGVSRTFYRNFDTNNMKWTKIDALSDRRDSTAQVDVSVTGNNHNPVAVWVYVGENSVSAMHHDGKDWGNEMIISEDHGGMNSKPNIAFSPSGDGVAMWFVYKSSGSDQIRSNSFFSSLGWQADSELRFTSPDLKEDVLVQTGIEITPSGRALTVWEEPGSTFSDWYE